VELIRKSVEYIKEKKERVRQIRFYRSLWEKEENQEKREPIEPCNHQSKVRVGLTFSNLRLCNSETEFNM